VAAGAAAIAAKTAVKAADAIVPSAKKQESNSNKKIFRLEYIGFLW
jgi:hypothetical protein